MEPYGNMNSSGGRVNRNQMNQNYRNQMNQNHRNSMNQNCNQCSGSRNGVNNNNGGRQMLNNQRRMMNDNAGRNIEVECVCKVSKNCHQNDPMEKLGDEFPLVMAYVPWQQWGDMYDAECGLMQGTIFKDLNLEFCGVRC